MSAVIRKFVGENRLVSDQYSAGNAGGSVRIREGMRKSCGHESALEVSEVLASGSTGHLSFPHEPGYGFCSTLDLQFIKDIG